MIDGMNTLIISDQQMHLLERLCNAHAVSGAETEVRKIVLEEVRDQVLRAGGSVQVDALGNILVRCPVQNSAGTGSQPPLRVMVAAHMDEVGMMITNKEGDGLFRFDTVGGIDSRHLVGKPVEIGKEHHPGVIGAKPIHLTSRDELSSRLSLNSLRIDIGPSNGEKVKIGDRAAFATCFRYSTSETDDEQPVDNSSPVGGLKERDVILAKALDDRLGVATLVGLVKNPPPSIELLAAFTVQEEVGLRGAQVAAYSLDPQVAVVLDCTPAMDQPSWDGSENERFNTRLGYGPAIYVADRATISDPRLVRHFVDSAENSGIKYQLRQPGGGGTDAGAIHKQRSGIPSISVSVPGRHLHTPASIVQVSDWANTIALLSVAMENLSPEILAETR